MPKGREFPPEIKTQALALIRGGCTIAAVGKKLGVARSTLCSWSIRRSEIGLNDDLQAKVSEYMRLTVEGAKAGIEVLEGLARNPKVRPSVRLRAAQILIASANEIAVSSEHGEMTEAQGYIEEAAAG